MHALFSTFDSAVWLIILRVRHKNLGLIWNMISSHLSYFRCTCYSNKMVECVSHHHEIKLLPGSKMICLCSVPNALAQGQRNQGQLEFTSSP